MTTEIIKSYVIGEKEPGVPLTHERIFHAVELQLDPENELQGVMFTKTDGAVAVSLVDTPDIWQQLMDAVAAKKITQTFIKGE